MLVHDLAATGNLFCAERLPAPQSYETVCLIDGPPSYSLLSLMPLRSMAQESSDLARGRIRDPYGPGYNFSTFGCRARKSM